MVKGQAAVPKTEFLGGADILGVFVHGLDNLLGQFVSIEVLRYLVLELNSNLRVDGVYEQLLLEQLSSIEVGRGQIPI